MEKSYYYYTLLELITILSTVKKDKKKESIVINRDNHMKPINISLRNILNIDYKLKLLNDNPDLLGQIKNNSKLLEQLFNLLCNNNKMLTYENLLIYLKDKKDCYGRNFIHYLCEYHHYDSLDYFVLILIKKYGYDLNAFDNDGKTYIEYVIKYNDDNIILIDKLFNYDMKVNKIIYSKL